MVTKKLTTSVENFHLLTGRTTTLLNRFLTQQFKEEGIGISREQWSILAVLWLNDGCSQQYLATETNRDKPSTTRLLDNLEKDGFITRSNDPNDRRSNLIFLTNKGKAIESKINEVVYNTLAIAMEGVAEEEIEVVKKSFEKVYNNIIRKLK